MEKLDASIEDLFDTIRFIDYDLKETHDFTLILPKEYWGPGSFAKWIRVGWALKNTSPKLFLTWVKFSSQSDEFSFNDMSDLREKWDSFAYNNSDGLTKRSIMYWAKLDASKKYKDIRRTTIDYFIEETLHGATEFDLANVLFNIFKDVFVCVSIKCNVWYEYINNRWFEIDSGTTLRKAISKKMHDIYTQKTRETINAMHSLDQGEEKWAALQKRSNKMADICMILKKTNWKNNIMREARELFYDKDFMNKLDENQFLLCFNNGVIDFKNKIHREGHPHDYVSKCTNTDYKPLDYTRDSETIKEVKQFMEELFPIKELRNYMWEHLASSLIGTNDNQTFNIYTGSGANGKSKLVDLLVKSIRRL